MSTQNEEETWLKELMWMFYLLEEDPCKDQVDSNWRTKRWVVYDDREWGEGGSGARRGRGASEDQNLLGQAIVRLVAIIWIVFV